VTVLFALLALNVIQTVLFAAAENISMRFCISLTQIKVLFATFPKMRTFQF